MLAARFLIGSTVSNFIRPGQLGWIGPQKSRLDDNSRRRRSVNSVPGLLGGELLKFAFVPSNQGVNPLGLRAEQREAS